MCVVGAACSSDTENAGTGTSDAGGEPGGYVLEWEEPVTDEGREARELLETSRVLHDAVTAVNRTLVLPNEVPIIVGDNIQIEGEVMQGPAAIAENILMPLQFVTDTRQDNEDGYGAEGTPEEIDQATVETVQFATLHEMGHNLIRIFGLPTTGNEEDAADQFAVVMLTVMGDGEEDLDKAVDATLAAADTFEFERTDEPRSEEAWWDEHTVTEQRARNLVCLAAGNSQEAMEAFEGAEEVDQRRLQSCPVEFQRALTAWLTLLQGHFQPGIAEEVEAELAQLNEAAHGQDS